MLKTVPAGIRDVKERIRRPEALAAKSLCQVECKSAEMSNVAMELTRRYCFLNGDGYS